MVCAKCQNKAKTTLATPVVKKKSEMYYGSPASSSATGAKKSATLGQTGISKSKLLSKSAKNPFAQYSASCTRCSTKVSQGHAYCNQCAYKQNVCHICGKPDKKTNPAAPVVSGQKFSSK
ncbi:hypothetical protein DL546_000570 [Coniochaeta pulveracea]|uniref:Cysteine-rich PDZ-binding protein n=1 Tax=Coniochaeta pulveracea TaxID=177199 RepID=A0A420XXB2_9PEZI|nr:hypothetical protein DL546_000570 [Coniochaeta pulveracea]